MNFGGMMRPVAFKKPGSGKRQERIVCSKIENRRFAALREASEILECIPRPGESLHAIMTGRYDLTDLLDAIFERTGCVDILRVATLSFNARNVTQIESWARRKIVSRFVILCSAFFQAHNPTIYDSLAGVFQGTVHRLAACRNHCKVVTLAAPGVTLAMEGSANLRTNGNREQFALYNVKELHDWHAQWIDEQVFKYEVKQS